MTSEKLPDQLCPACGVKINAGFSALSTGEKPRPGAISICIHCKQVCQFDDTLHLVKLEEADVARLGNAIDYLNLCYMRFIIIPLAHKYTKKEDESPPPTIQ